MFGRVSNAAVRRTTSPKVVFIYNKIGIEFLNEKENTSYLFIFIINFFY
jgi:hypothetical protein